MYFQKIMRPLYALIQLLLLPLLLVVFALRLHKNKEHKTRWPERFGGLIKSTKTPRPTGNLIHLQAASVGEAISLLPLINTLKNSTHILLTTGTVTSANLMAQRLPNIGGTHQIIHQFTPLDNILTVRAFYQHWRPTTTIFTESDFWPELLTQAAKNPFGPILINARISDKSFPKYQRFSWLFKPLISRFTHVLAQQEKDATRLTTLGAQNVKIAGNLKYDAAPLPTNITALKNLQEAIKNRPILLFASTHNGEEEQALHIHTELLKTTPNLLTIIAPRHPHRGEKITHMARLQYRTAQRSQNEKITDSTHIYIADTMGELGTFYTLITTATASSAVIMGGSLISHGGQNPLEPLRQGAQTFSGPHMHNFTDMLPSLAPIFIPAKTPESLLTDLKTTLKHPKIIQKTQQEKIQTHIQTLTGPTPQAAKLILEHLK